jgi:hypothetical protein
MTNRKQPTKDPGCCCVITAIGERFATTDCLAEHAEAETGLVLPDGSLRRRTWHPDGERP